MRKQILILGHNYVPHFVDIFNQYTKLFPKEKFEVTVAYLTGSPDDEVRHRTLAEHVLFLNLSKKNIRTLKFVAIKKLLALCRQNHFQLVICHRYKPTYIMMWVSIFHRIPSLIFVMHELKTMSSINRQLLIASLFRKNMWFAGVSNAVRNDIRKNLWAISKKQIVTLYNAIDVELIAPQLLSKEEARKALHLPEDAFIFGNLARLVPNKDHESLISAFAKIKHACPHAKLIIMGNGELECALKAKAASLELLQEILFPGFIEDGFRYMKAFDCFVLSSIQEAFGRVLIEAMVAKLPIIATAVHGIPEVMGETGIVIPPKDLESLSRAMMQLYKTKEEAREILGETGYRHMQNHFSIPAFQKQFSEIFPQIDL
jgi:glycosyltransferase involved in cell wall biosynthesis